MLCIFVVYYVCQCSAHLHIHVFVFKCIPCDQAISNRCVFFSPEKSQAKHLHVAYAWIWPCITKADGWVDEQTPTAYYCVVLNAVAWFAQYWRNKIVYSKYLYDFTRIHRCARTRNSTYILHLGCNWHQKKRRRVPLSWSLCHFTGMIHLVIGPCRRPYATWEISLVLLRWYVAYLRKDFTWLEFSDSEVPIPPFRWRMRRWTSRKAGCKFEQTP